MTSSVIAWSNTTTNSTLEAPGIIWFRSDSFDYFDGLVHKDVTSVR